MIDDERQIETLLREMEHALPVPTEARSETRQRTLALFDELVTAEASSIAIVDFTDPRDDIQVSAHAEEDRGGHRFQRVLAAAAAVLCIAMVGSFVARWLDDPDVVATGDDPAQSAEDVVTSVPADTIDLTPLADGLRIALPAGASLETLDPGRAEIEVDGGAATVTVMQVASWGEALVVDSIPGFDAPVSLLEWLADSSTDQSSLAFVDVDDRGIRVQAWRTVLTPRAAEAIGCNASGTCGSVAVNASGAGISLEVDRMNELISVELPSGQTLLIHTSYENDQAADELLSQPILAAVLEGLS